MVIPIRATFKRAEKRGERAEMVSAVYADVPNELVVGRCAQLARRHAMRAGDEESVERISRAMERAEDDGKIIIMR